MIEKVFGNTVAFAANTAFGGKDNAFGVEYEGDKINNDFGFSAVGEEEIKTNDKATLDQIWQLINPLLINLQKDPDKPMLRWPNRADKIKILQDTLRKLTKQ